MATGVRRIGRNARPGAEYGDETRGAARMYSTIMVRRLAAITFPWVAGAKACQGAGPKPTGARGRPGVAPWQARDGLPEATDGNAKGDGSLPEARHDHPGRQRRPAGSHGQQWVMPSPACGKPGVPLREAGDSLAQASDDIGQCQRQPARRWSGLPPELDRPAGRVRVGVSGVRRTVGATAPARMNCQASGGRMYASKFSM